MFRVGVITASDKGSIGERKDISGVVMMDILRRELYDVVDYCVLADDRDILSKKMIELSDELKVDLILTTGGTGFSSRDITPEATLDVIDRMVPGISEAMRSYSMTITKRGMLSRGISGIRGETLIINMPGSPKAVSESLEYIIDTLKHGLEILTGTTGECGRE